ncbi:hypothetical protein K378_04688 [Streptomyces sp. Amel2xB2]|uniref:vWA domain-containing protein n=1 Tax=Streptomyces sp. Amel2xB2 TaxID=1305829 RepID=UPI000DB9A06F|nr:VWA domain-containing protein [Streptomyces sp. Amel2xB2]RAJ59991.1 hypothetical protein K378_04688 [Streptomyces sp. Amel2xB2]
MSSDPAVAPLLRHVDRAAFAVALSARLRAGGVPVDLTSTEVFVRALAASPPLTRTALYWSARISLVRAHSELALFDRVFAAVFDDAVLEMDPNARRDSLGGTPHADDSGDSPPAVPPEAPSAAGPLPWVTRPQAVAGSRDADGSFAVPERLPSGTDAPVDTPFEQLSPEETALLGRWLESAVRDWPLRRSRRFTSRASGRRIAFRATVARSRRTGWEPMELVRSGPARKPRRVVMVCDVSKSMQAQATAYLHLMRALARTAHAEVFAFGTSLTRLTGALSHRSAQTAVEEATAKVTDRFGGTRIAASLRTLLTSHHGDRLRGAVVIIGSDGWDSDPPEELSTVMAWLNRRAYKVIWMNPRASAPGFEPRVAAMAAALPHCDLLLPADTFGSLAAVVAEISRSAAPAAAGTGPRRYAAANH